MRTFIAVEITGSALEAVLRYEEQLRQFPAKVRWARPEQMHLTLKFLGEIEEAQAEAVAEALKDLTGENQAFEAELKGLGGFPNLRRPNILCAGVEAGRAELTRLADQVERALEGLGFKREKRPYSPHLTLGRVKSIKGLDPVCKKLEADGDRSFGAFSVGEIVFFKSVLSPSGAEYTALGRFELAK